MRHLLLATVITLAGCNAIKQPATMVAEWTTAWREVATPEDHARLRNWRKSFVSALQAARRSGNSAQIAQEGRLLEPDSALAAAPLPNGMYSCRVIKLGAKSPGSSDYLTYPPFSCRVRVERDLQRLSKLSGSQRYVGLVFPGDALRQVFLGTLVLGDERRALQYGQDRTRDVAGYIEHIGPARWRLIVPQPRFESQFDVMELVPVEGVRP